MEAYRVGSWIRGLKPWAREVGYKYCVACKRDYRRRYAAAKLANSAKESVDAS
jgi:hypothetical protein